MNRNQYSAGAVKHSFWFMEFRKIMVGFYYGKNPKTM
ncbi:DUF1819 family protein [Anaerostipes sp. 494a]|nr:DUF1819 family protein [Anaerostipes sp. 494a]